MSDDGFAIVAVIARYARALDDRDFEAVAACFTPDARATYSGVELPPGLGKPMQVLVSVHRTLPHV